MSDQSLFEREANGKVVVTFRLIIHPVAGVAEYSLQWYAEPADAEIKGQESSSPMPIQVARRRMRHVPASLERIIDEVTPPFPT